MDLGMCGERTMNLGWVFSEDEAEQILLKLPVKSLLRFTAVSKEWNAFIKSSYFTAIHLRRWNPKPISLLLKRTFLNHNYEVELLGDEATRSRKDLSFLKTRGFCNVPVAIVGSSYGLVCLSIFDMNRKDVTGVIVWNPATTQFRLLPKAVNDRYCDLLPPLLGFAFLPDIGDYKLVKIQPGEKQVKLQAEVFTGSTNSWRAVNGISSSQNFQALYYAEKSIMINEVLYSLVEITPSQVRYMLAFNLRDDAFKMIPLPSEERGRNVRLLSWKNSPAILVHGSSEFEFWVMSEDHNSNGESTLFGSATHMMSWSKQFVINCSLLSRLQACAHVIGIWKDQFLFLSIDQPAEDYYARCEEVVLYDPVSQKERFIIKGDAVFKYIKAVDYVQSLLPVKLDR